MPKDANPTPAPENTPIPGGGRWRWDYALPGWVEVTEDPAPEPTAPTQPTDTKE